MNPKFLKRMQAMIPSTTCLGRRVALRPCVASYTICYVCQAFSTTATPMFITAGHRLIGVRICMTIHTMTESNPAVQSILFMHSMPTFDRPPIRHSFSRTHAHARERAHGRRHAHARSGEVGGKVRILFLYILHSYKISENFVNVNTKLK